MHVCSVSVVVLHCVLWLWVEARLTCACTVHVCVPSFPQSPVPLFFLFGCWLGPRRWTFDQPHCDCHRHWPTAAVSDVRRRTSQRGKRRTGTTIDIVAPFAAPATTTRRAATVTGTATVACPRPRRRSLTHAHHTQEEGQTGYTALGCLRRRPTPVATASSRGSSSTAATSSETGQGTAQRTKGERRRCQQRRVRAPALASCARHTLA